MVKCIIFLHFRPRFHVLCLIISQEKENFQRGNRQGNMIG
jgi:hypothetical protein